MELISVWFRYLLGLGVLVIPRRADRWLKCACHYVFSPRKSREVEWDVKIGKATLSRDWQGRTDDGGVLIGRIKFFEIIGLEPGHLPCLVRV